MPIINKTTQFFGVALTAALIPFLLTAVTSLALLLTGSATQTEITLPFLAMMIVSIGIFLIMAIPTALLSMQERSAILRLINDHWVRWPQYRSEADWHKAAENIHKKEMKANAVSWIPVIIITILMAVGIGIPALTGVLEDTNPLIIALPLAAFYVIVVGLVVGRSVVKQWQSKATYQRRSTSPIPNVYIGKNGLYDEVEGYQPFSGLNTTLTDVTYKETSPASLNFKIMSRYGSSSVRGALRSTDTVSVRVLADYRDEAQKIVDRLVSEGIVRK